jgi:hypothetical protein
LSGNGHLSDAEAISQAGRNHHPPIISQPLTWARQTPVIMLFFQT